MSHFEDYSSQLANIQASFGINIKYFYGVWRKTKTHKKHDNHVYHLCDKLNASK